MKTNLLFFILFFTAFNCNLIAQIGLVDTSFNTIDNGDFGDASSFSLGTMTVYSTIYQLDGKMIIAGDFQQYNSFSFNRIIRVDSSGKVDNTFSVGTGFNARVSIMCLQPDGKILIGGDFTSYNGIISQRIIRLNNDGSVDNSFQAGTGFNGVVGHIALQQDGKIVVTGSFTSYNNSASNYILRLNSNGSIDTSFNIGSGFNAPTTQTIIQSDGKIIIAGAFTTYKGVTMNRIVRLNNNGNIDSSFNIGGGFDNVVISLGYQVDGKIVAGGNFFSYNGISRQRIARINPNGTIDGTFVPSNVVINNQVLSIAIQANGKILLGGLFTGTPLGDNLITRLNSNGSQDFTFNQVFTQTSLGLNSSVRSINVKPNGQILIGGGFNNSIALLDSNGNVLPVFRVGNIGFNGPVYIITSQADGKILVGGDFTTYNGLPANKVVRLFSNGDIDTSFNIGSLFNIGVRTILVQPDGKILIGASLTNGVSSTFYHVLSRVNQDGTEDTSFNSFSNTNGGVLAMFLQNDGKILVGGNFFLSFNVFSVIQNYNNLIRLNPNGSHDISFSIGNGFDNSVHSIYQIQSGDIYVGGSFNSFNSISTGGFIKIDSFGSLIQGGPSFGATTKNIVAQPDGKIIYSSGSFIGRLITNNITDTSFNVGIGANNTINSVSLQSDGKIILGGKFTSFNGLSTNRIIRIESNGSIDTTFNVGSGFNNEVNSTYIQSDNKLLIGGDFSTYNGIFKKRIVRLLDSCPSLFSIDTIVACDSITWIDGITYNLTTNTPIFTTFSNGCLTMHFLDLTINNLNASYTNTDNGGGNFTFTNTSTGSFTQTHWAFGDGTTSTLANPTHTFNANGTFVVVLTVNDSTTNNTCMDYYLDTLVVTGVVNPAPCVAGFVMYPDGNNNVTVVNSSTGNNLSYFWDFGDGDTSTMQFPSHTYATAGPFYLCLTVNDGVSCVDTYCDSIGINGVLFNKQTGFSINVIAPPVVVGVDEQGALATNVTIYPNPTTNEFVVELTNFSPSTQINIISVEGKMVYTNSSINTNKIIVDAANWSRGIYVVKITDKQSSKVVKLVKQ